MIPVILFIEFCHKFRDSISVIAHSSCQKRKVWGKQTVKKEKENSNENTSSNTFLEKDILQVSLFYSKNINKMPFDERGSSQRQANFAEYFTNFLCNDLIYMRQEMFLGKCLSWRPLTSVFTSSSPFFSYRSEQTKRCRDDCLCEQKYKWHRLLAYDPDDDCHGIFMDWFLFPSSCACRCTDPLLGG